MRRLIAGLVLLCGMGLVCGSAAALALNGSTLGAAAIGTPRCASAGLGVLQNLSAATVVSVTVSALPAGCGGATLQATVNNGVTTGSGSATVPIGGGSVTVPLGVAPAVTAVEETDLVLVGP